MKTRAPLVVALVVIGCFVACDESFSPSAFEPRMTIYSVLSTQSDSQFVRVYSSYGPEDNDPWKNPEERSVIDADVRITEVTTLQETTTYTLRGITLPRADKSRYKSDIHAYFVYPMKVKRGAQYTLSVSSPTYGTATASIAVPATFQTSLYPAIAVQLPVLLGDPWKYPYDVNLDLRLSREVMAFQVRFFLEYEIFDPPSDSWWQLRIEVPFHVNTISSTMDVYDYSYPKMVRRETNPESRLSILDPRGWDHFKYLVSAYQIIVKLIVQDAWAVRFKNAVFYLIQIDQPLYNYYSTINLFHDKYSTRLDEPDYSNVKGGFGVFGSTVVDSVAYQLPEKICPPPQYYIDCR